jgi:hypothetical protein
LIGEMQNISPQRSQSTQSFTWQRQAGDPGDRII